MSDPSLPSSTSSRTITASNQETDPMTTNKTTLTDREKEQASASWRTPFNPDWDIEMPVRRPAGFDNSETECYRNVTLQMLLHAPVFVHWVNWYKRHHTPDGDSCQYGTNQQKCKVCMFHEVCATYWDSARTEYKAKFEEFWNQIFSAWAGGSPEGQQDSAEFFEELYRQMYEDTRELFRIDLEQLCRVALIQIRTCHGDEACSEERFSTNEMAFLHATFNPDLKAITIDEAICHAFKEKDMGDDTCGKCKNPRTSREFISHPPELLLVQLNRIDEKGVKISRPIQFSETITIGPEYFDPRLGTVREPVDYELSSVQMHRGDCTQSGHYTIAVKCPKKSWILLDDNTVKDYQGFEAFANAGSVQQEAYIFAYRRLPLNPDYVEMSRVEAQAQKDAKSIFGSHKNTTDISLPISNDNATPWVQMGEVEEVDVAEKPGRGRLEVKFITKDGTTTLAVSMVGMLKNDLLALTGKTTRGKSAKTSAKTSTSKESKVTKASKATKGSKAEKGSKATNASTPRTTRSKAKKKSEPAKKSTSRKRKGLAQTRWTSE